MYACRPPEDDYRLIVNAQQVSDLVVVHRAVKFSKMYSLQDIKERWCVLASSCTAPTDECDCYDTVPPCRCA